MSKVGKYAVTLFGLVFVVAGFAVAYFTLGKMTTQYMSSKNWILVPAQIESVELKVNRGESTTYLVEANYRYSYQGQSYQNDKVSLSTGSDNLGSYWQDLHRKLEADQANNSAQVWINPDKPSESVLDRTFRWAQVAFGAMFIVMFAGAGFAVMWFSIKGNKSQEQVIEEAKEGIASNEKNGFWFMLWFGGIFFLMGSFFFLMTLPEIIDGEYEALFTLIFVIVGAAIIAFAIRGQKRYRMIGPTPLVLDPLPGAIGGHVGGRFDIAAATLDKPITATLTCQRRVKSGKNTSIRVLWQESMVAYPKQMSSGTRLSFVFDSPADLPTAGNNGVEWKVEAQGELSLNSQTAEFSRSWFIPVSAESNVLHSSISIPEKFLQQQQKAKQQAAREEVSSLVDLKQQGQYLRVENVRGRPVIGSLAGLAFGAIFAGIGVFTISQDWWPGYVFVFVGLLVVFGSIFLLGREIEVKIDNQTRILYMRRKWFGIVLYKREVMLFEPSQFSIKKTSSSSSGSKVTEYYAVKIDSEGKKVLLAEGIKGKDVANALKEALIEKTFADRGARYR